MDEELRESVGLVLEEYYGTDAHCEKPWLIHRRDCANAILRLIASVRVREQREAFAAGARWAEAVVEESEGCTFIYATDMTDEAARRYPDA